MIFAMIIRELMLKNFEDVSPIEKFRLGVYLLDFTKLRDNDFFQVFQ